MAIHRNSVEAKKKWSCSQIVFVVFCIVSVVANGAIWFIYFLPYGSRIISTRKETHRHFSNDTNMTVADVLRNIVAFKEETVVKSGIIKQEEEAVNETLIEYYRNNLQPFGFTMESFLIPYKIKSSELHRRVDKFYNTCAVVGSSGILKDSQCGEEISSHEFIIRMNMAPVDGYQKDVGNRTDLMSVNYPICHALEKCLRSRKNICYKSAYTEFTNLKKSILFLHEFHTPSVNWKHSGHLQFIESLKRKHILPDVRVSAKNATLRLRSAWNITMQPSGGLRGITASLLMCRSISMYGYYPFSEGPDGESLRYHYFDDRTWNNKIHNMSEEHNIYRKLDKIGRIRLVTKKCKTND